MPRCSVAVRSLAFALAGLGATLAVAQQPAAPAVTVPFERQSVELAEAGRGALDGLARTLSERGTLQIEVRGYASGEDSDARKIAMARALSVRSYLIDQGVKGRISVVANGQPARTPPRERVDVILP